MEVSDEDLSSTDVNSDSDYEERQGQYISLTDVNSDSGDSFILVTGENISLKKVVRKQQSSSFQYKGSAGITKPSSSIRKESNVCRENTEKKSCIKNTYSSEDSIMERDQKNITCRNAFISDNSSDEELPVMDSLRARLARKRQNAVASPFLPSNIAEKPLGSLYKNSHIDTVETEFPSPAVTAQLSGDSSGDEADQHLLSSFLSSPTHGHLIGRSSSLPESGSLPMSNKDTSDCKSSDKSSDNINFTHVQIENVDIENTCTVSKTKVKSNSACTSGPSEPKRKRTAEEVEENKRRAQEKKAERERLKQAKEAEKQMRKIERESKKQFSLGSCLKFVKVMVDTNIMNLHGFGACLFKACEELGVSCVTEQLIIPYTIMWKREVMECSMSSDTQVETVHSEIIENEVLAIVPTVDFVQMVYNFKQKQRGIPVDGVVLRSYVNTVNSHLRDKSVTLVVQGIEQYFRDLKTQDKRQHREAVLSTDPNYVRGKKKDKSLMLQVSRVDIEEAVTDTQLQTGCSTFMIESQEDVADLLRRFSKAVAERPAKKDRFDPIFSFHEEGSAGVKVDRSGHGLLKVWKQQLLQFKNVSPDVAQALIAVYPSPQLLRQAYLKCSSEKEAIRLLENIVVRRGAGVLETTRRIGKELSRRIYTFLTSNDPNLILK